MKHHETAIGAQLAKNGILPHNIKLQIAIARYQNSGGSYGVALAMLNAAYGRGSEGQLGAANGHPIVADASSLNDDAAGRMKAADEAECLLPAASSPGHHDSAVLAEGNVPGTISPNRSAGLSELADEAKRGVPDAAARKMPGHAKRGAAAIGAVQGTLAKSLFDSTVLPDGRRLREVKWSECPRLSRRYRHLSRVLMAIHNVGIPADPSDTIDNLVNEDGLKEIISAVEKFNDIH
jgi:hypothetical protein